MGPDGFLRAVPSLDDRDGRDAQGNRRQDRRLEDALRAHERHAVPFKREALAEKLDRKNVASALHLLSEPCERG